MLQRVSKFFQRVRGEHSAGFDLYGNEYLVNKATDPTQKPRRSVKYVNGLTGSSDTIPMPWFAWLKGHRDDPPTIDELKQELINQSQFQDKIAQLKVADDKLRMQEMVERSVNQSTNQSSDVSAQDMIRQLEGELEQEKRLKKRAPVSKE